MYGILLVAHVITAFCLIGLVLIQQGKGAQAGAAFGSGASQTIFGSQGSTSFLSRATTMLAIAFFILNLALAYLVNKSKRTVSLAEPPAQSVPVQGADDSASSQVDGSRSDESGAVGPSDIPD